MDAKPKQTVEVEQGNVGAIYVPDANMTFLVFKAATPAKFVLFEGHVIWEKWAKKNGIQIVNMGPLAKEPQADLSTLLPPLPPNPFEQVELDAEAQLELMKKKRLQEIEKADKEKEDQSKSGVAS